MSFSWFRRGDPALPGAARSAGRSELDRLRAEVAERDEDKKIALEALRVLKPGVEPKILCGLILDACQGSFGISTFYLALVEYSQDRLTFPFYSEGGKARNITPRVFSRFGGLTTRVLAERGPLYFPEKRLQDDAGAVYTDAERITGLIPESWYGLPLGVGPGWPEPPFGVLSFQSFSPEAFSRSRREVFDMLGAALALALRTDPARPLRFE